MKLKSLSLILCFISVITSCVSITSQMQIDDKIKYRPILSNKYSRSLLNVEMDLELDNQVLLRMDHDQNKRYLDILIMKGAQKCYPALVDELRTREERIKSELYSGMKHDAANDLIVQRHKLEVLNLKLSDVLSKGVCHPEGPLYHYIRAPKLLKKGVTRSKTVIVKPNKVVTKPKKVLIKPKKVLVKPKKILAKPEISKIKQKAAIKQAVINPMNKKLILKQLVHILNSDNMFAFDSAKINPKYQKRLKSASVILKKYPLIHIHIYGHADNYGHIKYNEKLSKQRAESVKSYLNQLGVALNRMEISYVSSLIPYEKGEGEEYRLANRRVDITAWLKHE